MKSFAVAALILAILGSVVETPVSLASRHSAAAVALGPMTVQPAQARVGQMVTITGRTTGKVGFLPPLIYMQSAQTVPVHPTGYPCAGTTRESAAEAVVVTGGGGGGKGSRQNPPAGTAWQVQFRVPRHMQRYTDNMKAVSVTPAPGKYYLSAIAAGMDGFCGVNTKSGFYITVATITLVS